ncbi:MAG: serine/threonine-protein kinase [Myxococcota bacterium]
MSEKETETAPTVRIPAGGTGAPAGELRGRFRYRLIRRLGRGSFGSVYLARCVDHDPRRDDSPPAQVALKILRTTKGPALDMLRRELAALLAIQNDRIPHVFDWAIDSDRAFVAMQYFPAGSLRELMNEEGPVDEEIVWRVLGDVLAALDVAHRKAVLHLDIKPANVLLDRQGGFVLTDFGVAQYSRMHRGLLPFSVGTRGYQAPEQKQERFDEYDLRTDVFGLGATAWALATGIHLADRPDLMREPGGDWIYGLPPLSEYRIHCSRELEDTVMGMLHLDPDLRPGSVTEVRARVRAGLSGAPLAAETSGMLRRPPVEDDEVEALISSLVDPLLIAICRQPNFRRQCVRFDDRDVLCAEGEHSYYAFLLLRGTVVVERDGREVTRVTGEGTFLGEVATLMSLPRTATLRASGPAMALVLNAAELERFVTSNPAMGLRVIRSLALRLSKQPPSDKGRD